MSTTASNVAHRNWRESYQAALLELDSTRLPHRIAEAEHAVTQRAREMFREAGNHIEEECALDDARSALRALRNTLESPAAAADNRDLDQRKIG
jgi:hypothetical protein